MTWLAKLPISRVMAENQFGVHIAGSTSARPGVRIRRELRLVMGIYSHCSGAIDALAWARKKFL